MNRPCATTAGGLSLSSQSDDGAYLRGEQKGQGGGVATAGDDLPEFKPAKVYLLRPETIAAFEKAARRNLTKVVIGTGLTVAYSADGVTVGSSDNK